VSGNIDRKFAKLKELGFVGDTASMETEFYLAKGATSNSRTDAEYEFLGGLGFEGALNDRWYAYLTSLGYTGSVDDMIGSFWLNDASLGGGYPPFTDVDLLLHCDTATFPDSSLNARSTTPLGGLGISTASKFGAGAGSYNQNNTRLQVGAADDWTYLHNPTALWTFEAWVFNVDAGSNPVVFATSFGNSQRGVQLRVGTSNQVLFEINRGVSSSPVLSGSTATNLITPNVWHHLAVCCDLNEASNNVFIFVNGIRRATLSKIAGRTPSSSAPSSTLTIGGATFLDPGTAVWLGRIDEIRITKNQRLYDADFTPPTEAFPDS
jgi:hypothetical protein